MPRTRWTVLVGVAVLLAAVLPATAAPRTAAEGRAEGTSGLAWTDGPERSGTTRQNPPSASDDPIRIAAEGAASEPIGQAVAVSQALFGDASADFGIVARSDNYPDALGGSALGFGIAPLLFTPSSGPVAAATLAELQRVVKEGGTVYILGGQAAVPAEVDPQLQAAGFQVVRLAGAGREQTAAEVADEVIALFGQDGRPALNTMIVATSANWPDAVTAGQLGSFFGIPVLLTPRENLAAVAQDALSRYGPQTVLVMGGQAAVSDAVVAQVEAITGPGSTLRLGGATRTGTGVAIATYARELFAQTGQQLNYAVAVNLRREDAYAHVLSGSMVTGRLGGIFVPIEQDSGGSYLTEDVAQGMCDANVALLVAGGTDLVSDDTAIAIRDALLGDQCTPTGDGGTAPPEAGMVLPGMTEPEAYLVSATAQTIPDGLKESHGALTVEAVAIASVEATGGQQLVTTGTLTQEQDGSFSYASGPGDRLRIELLNGQVFELYVSQLDGDFTASSGSSFLRSPHILQVRVTEPALGTDYEFFSQYSNGEELITAQGHINDTQSGIEGDVDLTQRGTRSTPDGESHHAYAVQGTVTTAQLQLAVNYQREFKLIGAAIQDKGWFHHTWQYGGSTYELRDGYHEFQLYEGTVAELERWAYTATLTQDGTPIGGIELREVLGGLAAYFVGPAGEIELNSWQFPG